MQVNPKILLAGILIIIILLSAIFLRQCDFDQKPQDSNPLARVNSNYFYESDAEGIGKGLSKPDSVKQLNNYIDKWVLDQLILNYASKNLSRRELSKINRLVESYENALIVSRYEEELVNKEMDTVVTATQLAEYYAQNKEQYISGQNWLRCYFIKASRSLPDVENLRTWFKSNQASDFEKIKEFCSNNDGTTFALEKDKWIPFDQVLSQFPSNSIDEGYLNVDRILDRTDDDYIYLLRVFEFRDKDAPATLNQVQDEISRIILQQRRAIILQNFRNKVLKNSKKGQSYEKFY
jgi:hypothetical protein